MRGLGTAESPYIVDNFSDFLQAASVSGAYVEFDKNSPNKTLDLNDTEFRNGFTETITVNAAQIKGNGFEIKNFYFTGSADAFSFGTCSVYDLSFADVVASVPSSYFLTAQNLEWENGIFTCRIGSAGSTSYFADKVNFKKCSFNLKFDGRMWRSFQDCDLSDCNVILDYEISGGEYAFEDTSMKNVFVGGEILISAAGTHKIVDGGALDSFCFAADVSKVDGITEETKIWFYADTYTTTCIIDADRIADGIGFSTNETNSMLELTTAQCKNAEYLTSIGFPCAEVER